MNIDRCSYTLHLCAFAGEYTPPGLPIHCSAANSTAFDMAQPSIWRYGTAAAAMSREPSQRGQHIRQGRSLQYHLGLPSLQSSARPFGRILTQRLLSQGTHGHPPARQGPIKRICQPIIHNYPQIQYRQLIFLPAAPPAAKDFAVPER